VTDSVSKLKKKKKKIQRAGGVECLCGPCPCEALGLIPTTEEKKKKSKNKCETKIFSDTVKMKICHY
jgi:hypothetical protein